MGGPAFFGSSHVTRTLSVEPGIPVTFGADGVDGASGRSVTLMVTGLAATLLSLPLFVVHLHRKGVLVSSPRG